ncbi:MAG: MogA/MoaB family molybdenum cofactor biosynthesis protein [Desulfurococcales archaeon]|nr:MogA/MoaB family molybdenum cofactor biosynthesis protein [Desulfurococcales archaeon]
MKGEHHRHHGEHMHGTLRVALVVTSDRVSKGLAEDKLTPLVRSAVEEEGHVLIWSTIVPNKPHDIRRAVLEAASWANIVLVTGGTGPGPRDLSVETVREVAEKELPGLGELHRLESRESVGHAAFLSRTTAFVVGESLVMVSPGSPDAVEKALKILLDIGSHAVGAVRGRSRWDKGSCAPN